MAAINIRFTYTGLKDVDDFLLNLPLTLTHKVLGSANYAAAKPLVDRERQLAPEGPTGNLVDSIGAVRRPLGRSKDLGEVVVGPRRRKPYKGNAGHLLEHGTVARKYYNKNGRVHRTGKGPVQPFVIPAYNQTRVLVESLILSEIQKSIDRTVKKYLKP